MDITLIAEPVEECAPAHIGSCSNCQGATLRPTRVQSAFWQDGKLVVLDDVPALVCDDCGEQFYDDNVVVQLDQLRGEGFPSQQAVRQVVVPVFSFADLPLYGAAG